MGPRLSGTSAVLTLCIGSLACRTPSADMGTETASTGDALPSESSGSEGHEDSTASGSAEGSGASAESSESSESSATDDGDAGSGDDAPTSSETDDSTDEDGTGDDTDGDGDEDSDGSSETVGDDCGNGQVDGDEVCDDGNQVAGDGCNPDCHPSGSVIWDIDVSSDGQHPPLHLALDAELELAVIGNGSDQLFVRRYDAEGNFVTEHARPMAQMAFVGAKLIAGPEGRLYFVERTTADPVTSRTVAIDTAGAEVWSHAVPEGASVAVHVAGMNAEGELLVIAADAGRHRGAPGQLWRARYDENGNAVKSGFVDIERQLGVGDAIVTSDGGVTHLGLVRDGATNEQYVAHLDANGDPAWLHLLEPKTTDSGYARAGEDTEGTTWLLHYSHGDQELVPLSETGVPGPPLRLDDDGAQVTELLASSIPRFVALEAKVESDGASAYTLTSYHLDGRVSWRHDFSDGEDMFPLQTVLAPDGTIATLYLSSSGGDFGTARVRLVRP